MSTNIESTEKNVLEMLNGFSIEEIGDDHLYTGLKTPIKKDAFKLSDEEKKQKIEVLFSKNRKFRFC